ncbi:hypothetical protein Tco_0120872 [Tanacetum coccineum]
MIIKKDSKIVKEKVERKSLALKAKKESSDEECLTFGSEDEEYAMAVRDFKKFFKRRDPNHFIGECPKPPRDKKQRAFVGRSWSHSGEENDEKIQDETCLVAQAPNETRWSTKPTHGFPEIQRITLNVVIRCETYSPSKTSPLVDDDLDKEDAIREIEKRNLENIVKDETLEIDDIVNIKESRNHPLENVIGNLNQRTLSSQAENQSNFYCFISTIEPKNVNKALGDESWIIAMQEELNQFIANDVWELVPQPKNMTIIGTKCVFRNKLDENGIVSQNKASQSQLNYSNEGQMFVEFVIQNQLFSCSLENFAQISGVPCQGACVFTDRWRLDELAYDIPSDGPYQTNLPPIEDIISSI